ncbi:MAG: DNA topoisomerase, partial [Fusobacteria bacterium]|nr:DNA topoisomerase [Fusobacteriota bacterium]
AKELLNIAQKLYEDKLISYPRSDCQYLPESQYGDRTRIISSIKSLEQYQNFQEENPKKSRIWNDKKITAHHAIIPTGDLSAYFRLTGEQKNIYHLVVEMYLTQFLKEHQYEEINIDISVEGYQFNRKIKIEKDPGWKRITQSDDEEEQEKGEYSKEFLSEIDRARKMWHIGTSVVEKNSQPPKRYTEGTLIKAMENIGSKIANLVKEMTQDIDRQKTLLERYRKIFNETSGIGTEATRAEIIETLKKRNYIELKKKLIYPTETGISLIKLISDNNEYKEKFDFLISPLTTAHIELELKKIQNGEKNSEKIMAYYVLKLKELKQYERIHNSIFKTEAQKIAAENLSENDCPKCGKLLKKRSGTKGDFFGCSGFPECRYTRNITNEQVSGKKEEEV